MTDEPTNMLSPRESPLSFVERFEHLIGKDENLPADASVQLDHYLYGVPKKE